MTATANDADATIEYLDADDNAITDTDTGTEALDMALAVGRNVVKVKVTAQDGTTTKTYTIVVARHAAAPTADCDVIWCANMTLGVNSADVVYGFSDDPTIPIGRDALAPAWFTVGTDRINVESLAYQPSSGRLFFFISLPGIPEGSYTLAIGDESFAIDTEVFGNTRTFAIESTTTIVGRLPQAFGEVVSVKLSSGGGSRTPGSEPVTAAADSVPESHDGFSPFGVRILFSEDIATEEADLAGAFTASGGTVTGTSKVDGRSDLWRVAVEPGGAADVNLMLAPGQDCTRKASPCTADGRTTAEELTVTVAGPGADALTAGIVNAPQEHDGSSPFEVVVGFSEDIQNSYTHVYLAAGGTTGGRPVASVRHAGSSKTWRITIDSIGSEPVIFRLARGGTCAGSKSPVLCTSDGRVLVTALETMIPGPARISAAGAEATEGTDEAIEFTVGLDRPALGEVTVDYATADGTATAGEDYKATSGTLTFSFREQTKTVSVPVLDDDDAEDAETFTLTLSNVSNGALEAAEATGTILDADAPLTVSADSVPDSHDGETGFRVRILFSEDIATEEADLAGAFTAAGGTVTGTSKVDGRADLWHVAVEPGGRGDMTLTLAPGQDCTLDASPCTEDGRTTADTLTVTVAGPGPEAEPLTAEVDTVATPKEHDGSSPFEVVVEFSEDLKNSYSHVYLAANGTTGGRPVASARFEGSSDKWRIRIDTIGSEPVVFRLAGGGTCAGPRSPVLCTSDGRVLSHDLEHTIPGPARISAADAEATEGTDQNMTFTVSLSRDAIGDVSVDYATGGGTATAGEDYTEQSGTLTFTAGERTKTVTVPLLDDDEVEDTETFTLTLSSASNGVLEDAEATGTILDTDTPPEPLTVSADSVPQSHDGETGFAVRILFSEAIATGEADLAGAFTAAGGTVTGTSKVGGRADLWHVAVRPSGRDDATLTLAPGQDCTLAAAPCTEDGRTTADTLTVTVAGPGPEPDPLTAEVDLVATPREHDGSSPFEVVVEFSEDLQNSYSHVYLAANGTTGGRPVASARHEGSSDKWRIRIDTIGSGPVVFRLAGGGTCAGPRSPVLCTSDGRVLSHSLEHTIPGPARISVADARSGAAGRPRGPTRTSRSRSA